MQRLRTGQIFTSSPTKQQENRALPFSQIKEKVAVVRFQIDAYKISTKHKGKDIMQSQISVHEFSGGILCDRRE